MGTQHKNLHLAAREARKSVETLFAGKHPGIEYKLKKEQRSKRHVLLEVTDDYFVVSESWTNYQLHIVHFDECDPSSIKKHSFILAGADGAKKLLAEYATFPRVQKLKEKALLEAMERKNQKLPC